MKNLMRYMVLFVVLLTTVRCEDPYMGDEFAAYENFPVGMWLSENPEYSEWVKLLKKAGLYDGLNIGSNFTCFVADNNAVAAYLAAYGMNSVEEMDSTQVNVLMRYHIIEGIKYYAKDFMGKVPSRTLSSDYLKVEVKGGGYSTLHVNDSVRITVYDLTPLNGVLHKLEQVLRPVVQSIWDLLDKERYGIFCEAMDSCGLKEVLQRYEIQLGEVKYRDYKTLFAIPDEVFYATGITSFEHLKALYPAEKGSDGVSPLYNFMAYHIAKVNSDYADLGTFSSSSSEKLKNISTYAINQLITVGQQSGRLCLNQHEANQSAMLNESRSNRLANNGYLHEITGLLPVSLPRATYVGWELTDFDVFRALSYYRQWSSDVDQSRYQIDRTMAETEGVRWETTPDNPLAVQYHLRSGQSWANNDGIMMELGYVGWAEFTTPVLPAGKYEIKMKIISFSMRGTARMYFDDKFFTIVDFNNSGGGYERNLGVVEFATSGARKVKFVAVKKGTMEIDQIIFNPKK